MRQQTPAAGWTWGGVDAYGNQLEAQAWQRVSGCVHGWSQLGWVLYIKTSAKKTGEVSLQGVMCTLWCLMGWAHTTPDAL